jgi:FemAB-related protein (PEP-CTERM system-associated)
MIEIRDVPTSEVRVWNEFVLRHPKATYAHLYEWTLAIRKAYRLHTLHLAAFVDHHIVAVLPVAVIRAPLRDPFAVCLPFSGYGGILVEAGTESPRLLTAFLNFLAEKKIPDLELRQLTDSKDSKYSEATLKLALPNSSDELWKQLDAKVRNLVRKAERSGLVAHWGNNQLEDFYRIYARNMAQLGTPVHSRDLFLEMSRQLSEVTAVLTVCKEEKVVAAMFVAKFRNQLSGPWASSLHQYNSLSPNMLLYWEALKYACEKGFAEFDFGRSQVDSGTYNFKKQWGAKPIPIECLRITVTGMQRRTSVDLYRGRSARIFSRLWRSLPYPVTLWIGPKLRRYLP